MTDETKIKGKAVREFRDAGTERLFEAEKTYEFGEGAFANYRHAGLVKPADDASPTDQSLFAPTPPRADD